MPSANPIVGESIGKLLKEKKYKQFTKIRNAEIG
jgi:hypothetical protein